VIRKGKRAARSDPSAATILSWGTKDGGENSAGLNSKTKSPALKSGTPKNHLSWLLKFLKGQWRFVMKKRKPGMKHGKGQNCVKSAGGK